MDLGLLVLHVMVGLLLFGHGAQKLWGWFGGRGVDGAGRSWRRSDCVPAGSTRFSAVLARSWAAV